MLEERMRLLMKYETLRASLVRGVVSVNSAPMITSPIVALSTDLSSASTAADEVPYTDSAPFITLPIAVAAASTVVTPDDLNACENSLREYDVKMAQSESNRKKVAQERHEFYTNKTVNDPLYQAIIRNWASEVGDILWPESPEQVELGHPVCRTGLPLAVQSVIEKSHSLLINHEMDVLTIISELQHMNWYYRVLCALQTPPSSRTLRILLSDPMAPRLSNDKSIKFIMATLHRIK